MSRVFHVTESKMENEDEHDERCIASAVVVYSSGSEKETKTATLMLGSSTAGYLIDHNMGFMLL